MEAKNLRYIVMLLNTDTPQYLSDGRKVDTHDGAIFCELESAREYAQDAIKKNLCTRFAIGVFVLDPHSEKIYVSEIETYGFRNDKKNVTQLALFK